MGEDEEGWAPGWELGCLVFLFSAVDSTCQISEGRKDPIWYLTPVEIALAERERVV